MAKKQNQGVRKTPVVTLLGHVDHGKTSILDKIRKTHVQEGEPGGITQHVRTHQIVHEGKKITFIDTPGHEVFTEMRSRGGKVADIAVLVVAADDSVMPQTKEAIGHIQNSGVRMIVAVNKIDLPGANIEKVKQDLSNNGVMLEGWGGDVPVIGVSAKTGKNIDQLLEMILLVADMQDLSCDLSKRAEGVVLESTLDAKLGAVSTVLIKDGSLKRGQMLLCEGEIGKIRALIDMNSNNVEVVEPGDAVLIVGVKAILPVGAIVSAAGTQKEIEALAKEKEKEQDKELKKEKEKEIEMSIEEEAEVSVLELLGMASDEDEVVKKELPVVLKTDASGTREAIETELEGLSDEEVSVKVLNAGTGNISEKDIMLAKNSKGLVIGFNVTLPDSVKELARRERVLVRVYNIIYELVDEIDDVLTSMLDKEIVEIVIGELEVRQVFTLSDGTTVAGCVVRDGTCSKGQRCYILRGEERIECGRIDSLRVEKDEVKQVKTGQECGIILEEKIEIQEGDKVVCYRIEK